MENKTNVFVWVGIGIAVVIALLALSIARSNVQPTPDSSGNVGGVTNYDELDATAIKIGGNSGSRVGPIIVGTCSLFASNLTVAATSTAVMDCAVTGVVSGDTVFAEAATSTPGFGTGWTIGGAIASTTSGFISVNVNNGTGVSAIIPAGIASSTRYQIWHPRTTIPGL